LKPPYLILLRMGFALPPRSRGTRWALTPPFHPYPRPPRGARRRFVFCGTFLHPSSGDLTVTLRGDWALPSILSYGVRTFLSPHGKPRGPRSRTCFPNGMIRGKGGQFQWGKKVEKYGCLIKFLFHFGKTKLFLASSCLVVFTALGQKPMGCVGLGCLLFLGKVVVDALVGEGVRQFVELPGDVPESQAGQVAQEGQGLLVEADEVRMLDLVLSF